MRQAEAAREAAEAHTNLNTWGSIVTICEGGHFYGSHNHKAIEKVIALCKAQMQRELRNHDAAMALLQEPPHA